MSGSDSADSKRLERRLWAMRAAVLPWLVLVLGPMFLEMKNVLEPVAIAVLYSSVLIPAIVLHLTIVFVNRRPGLAAAGVFETLLFLFTARAGRGGVAYVPYFGWSPVIWAGLLALCEAAIVLLAWRAWLLAPSAGPGRHLSAFALAMAPFVIWSALAPSHGWAGHRVSHNEASAIGDIRSLISSQVAYQSANGGFYDVPECLLAPTRCLPAYPANAPTFLDPQLAHTATVKNGYHRVFHPGPPAEPAAVRKAGASATSLQSFAYVAVPIVPGETGVRAFCGDSSGRLCYTRDGSAPAVENGECAPSCETLR